MAQEYDTAELIYFQTATEVERGDAPAPAEAGAGMKSHHGVFQ